MSTKGVTDSFLFSVWVWVYRFRTFFSYRTQAVIWLVYSGFTSFYSLITLTVIYSVSSGVPGWSYFQILALSSTVTIAMNVIYSAIDPWNLVREMRQGGIDMQLARPYGIVTALLNMPDVWPVSVAGVATGLGILVFALFHVSFSAVSMLEFILVFSLGLLSLVMFMLMLTVVSYHLFKSANFISRVMGVMERAGSYPLNIYGVALTMLFTIAFPIGIASYYPAETLFGMISMYSYLTVIVLEIGVTAVSYKAVHALMKNYASGGG